jgi:hypothetical protein
VRHWEPPIVKTLGPLAAEGADARQIAASAVAIWNAIDGALSPVIGLRGSGALYKRSLHLARADHPWLAVAYDGALLPGDYSSLQAALAQQSSADAAAGHDALLQTFHDLLADLIGRSLTHRLLQAVWEPPTTGTTAGQDTSP